MQIFFCEKCSRRLSDADIQSGAAIVLNEQVYCKACARASGIEAAAPQAEQKKPSHRMTKTARVAKSAALPAVSAKRPAASILIPLAAIAAAVALLLLTVGTGRSSVRDTQAPPPPPPVIQPEQKPVPPSSPPPPLQEFPPALPADQPRQTPTPVQEAPPKPEPPPKPPVQPLVQPAAAPSAQQGEEVLLASDLEQDDAGWIWGRRVEDTSLPDSKWAYEAVQPSGVHSKRACFAAYKLKTRREFLFVGTQGVSIAFDCFVTGPDEVRLRVEVFDELTRQNWDSKKYAVPNGKWTNMRIPLAGGFAPDRGDPPEMPPDARIEEIKFGILPAGLDAVLRIDNLRIVKAKEAAPEKILFSNDFESHSRGWFRGQRISTNVPAGSSWALNAPPSTGNASFSRMLSVATWAFENPKPPNLCVFQESVSVVFDYFLRGVGDETLDMMVHDDNKKDDAHCFYQKPVQGRWTTLRIRLRDFSTGASLDPNDVITEFNIGVAPTGRDIEFIIDNFRIVEGP